MGDKNSEQSIMDKSMRSVFVGNIPYEATEEKLKEIFSEVGPVLSLKLVFDRESGKPKGYGFCEYKDQETALSAMRNLNGYEIGGRTLRVDNACTEKSRMEMQQLLQGAQVENPYGDHCNPDDAPEIITKTVASLPPEQMYELMKQMKICIQNNPNEARQMLILNPQLAYALLQAQVVMKIVDPHQALGMLYKPNQMPPVLTNNSVGKPLQIPIQSNPVSISNPAPPPPNPTIPPLIPSTFAGTGDIDLRPMDPRVTDVRNIDPRNSDTRNADHRANEIRNIDPRLVDTRVPRNIDQDLRSVPSSVPAPVQAPQTFPTDPRLRVDPRLRAGIQPSTNIPPAPIPPIQPQVNRLPTNGIPSDASDHEKAALIMQVLQLSDEQIAMLPPEQRASILVLKEQIAKSTQR